MNWRHFLSGMASLAVFFLTCALVLSRGKELASVVNVRHFGARGDGVTNDRDAINQAILAGRRIFFPPGIYLVKGSGDARHDGVQIPLNNRELFGVGAASIIRQDHSSRFLISVNQHDGGGRLPEANVRNVALRNLRLEGEVEQTGFSEHQHLLNLNGVTNVRITGCQFAGFCGDGIYLGSSNIAGVERHNRNVLIRDCLFDGINHDNRNAISCIDVSRLLVEKCIFRNVSRKNMPGAIDIEPDNHAFHIVEDVTIRRNFFERVGGNVAAVAIYLPPSVTNATRFDISENIFRDLAASALAFYAGEAHPQRPHAVHIRGNSVRGAKGGFSLLGLYEGVIASNHFSDTTSPSRLGYQEPATTCTAVAVHDNTFERCGGNSEAALIISHVCDLDLRSNLFLDAGHPDRPRSAIRFASSSVADVRLSGNVFRWTAAPPQASIQIDHPRSLPPIVAQANQWPPGTSLLSSQPAEEPARK